MSSIQFNIFWNFKVFIISTLQRILLSISPSHTLKAFAPYGYVVTLSNVCSLLLSPIFSAILFNSSVYTL